MYIFKSNHSDLHKHIYSNENRNIKHTRNSILDCKHSHNKKFYLFASETEQLKNINYIFVV